jgi:hypothetical protein
MKKLLFILFALVIQAALHAQEKKTLEGNGKMVTKEISISPFEELKASGVYELKLSQGNTESVKIEADENLQELFIVKNEGRTLIIEMKKLENTNVKYKSKVKVYVSFKNLTSMDLKTVGDVNNEGSLSFKDLDMKNKSVGDVKLKLTANKININNKSVGTFKLSGKADDAVLKSNGVGSLEAGDFIVQTVYIENQGVGHAEVNAVKQLKVKDNSMGKVQNKGAAPVRRMNKVRV